MRCVFLLLGGLPARFCEGPAPYLSSHHKYSHLVDMLAKLEIDDYFCGHIDYSRTVSRLLNERNIFLLHAVRDPRDVLLSQLAFALKHRRHFLHKYLKTLDNSYERQKLILKGSLPDGTSLQRPLAEKYMEINKWSTSNKILFIKYEELVGEKGNGNDQSQFATIWQIISFLGLPISKENAREICRLVYDSDGLGFRNGKVGDWPKHLSSDFLELFNSEMSGVMEYWGYD